MNNLIERLEKIVDVVQDEEVQFPEEYILSELRNIFKEEEVVQAVKKDLMQML